MPVWHERTREARQSGDLILVGIAQEQHPERCRLFAQWRGLDWPIFWDPFNLTESSVVPLAVGVDEHGIVRRLGMSLGELDEFLAAEYVAPAENVQVASEEPNSDPSMQAMLRLMHARVQPERVLGASEFDACVEALAVQTGSAGWSGRSDFRVGVALRLRAESDHARDGDLQASIAHWSSALRSDPGQYIWRRRIQQWGPVLDKPYPFYDWVDRAQQELRARGETPPELAVRLTTSEVSGRGALEGALGSGDHPDPDARVPRDDAGWIRVETALVRHTERGADGSSPAFAQLHVNLRLDAAQGIHWTNDAGPAELWIESASEWGLVKPRWTFSAAPSEISDERRALDFTLRTDAPPGTLSGTVFYYVCQGSEGECRYLAQDFKLEL